MLTLDRIETHQREQADKLTAEWKAYALRIATGDGDDKPADVLKQLAKFDRTLDDLRKITDSIQRRRELIAQAGELELVTAEAETATREFLNEIESFRKQQAEHEQRRRELGAKSSNADARRIDCQNARRELLAGCRPDLRERLETLRGQLTPLVEALTRHKDSIANGERLRQVGAISQEAADEVANAREELKTLEPQIEKLRGEIAQTEREAMEPDAIEI